MSLFQSVCLYHKNLVSYCTVAPIQLFFSVKEYLQPPCPQKNIFLKLPRDLQGRSSCYSNEIIKTYHHQRQCYSYPHYYQSDYFLNGGHSFLQIFNHLLSKITCFFFLLVALFSLDIYYDFIHVGLVWFATSFLVDFLHKYLEKSPEI